MRQSKKTEETEKRKRKREREEGKEGRKEGKRDGEGILRMKFTWEQTVGWNIVGF